MTTFTRLKRRAAVAVVFVLALTAVATLGSAQPSSAAIVSGIKGVVTNTSALPLSGIVVTVTSETTTTTTFTQEDGSYTVPLGAGTYRVQFAAGNCCYQPQYYDGSTTQSSSTPVTVVTNTFTTGINATLSPYGTISGTVTDDGTGLPIQGATVTANVYSCSCNGTATTTDINGNYTVPHLLDESYEVTFSATGYASEYYNDTDYFGADQVEIAGGVAVTDIDAALAATVLTGISGTVTDEITGLPISGITVQAVSTNSPGGGDAVTDADGNYTILDLEAGDYILFFNPCGCAYEPEFYDDATSPFDATPVTVVDGVTTTAIDAELAPLTTVSGHVTDTLGNPIEGVTVDIDEECGCTVGSAVTDADGYYEIVDIPAADYVVHFTSPDENQWTSEWYHDAYWQSAATVVSLTGEPSTIDETLVLARFDLTGTIVDGAGNPIPKATVRVYTLDGRRVGVAKTNANGQYAVRNLPAGEYHLRANKPFFGVARWGFGPKPYNPAPAQLGPGSTQFDFVLRGPGALSTTVTKGGVPVRNVKVTAYRADSEVAVATGKTDANGNLILQVPQGDYRLYYEATNRTLATWSGGAPDWATATTVTLTTNTTTVFDQVVQPKP